MPEETFYVEGIQIAKRGIAMDIQKFVPELTETRFVETFKSEPKPASAAPVAPVATEPAPTSAPEKEEHQKPNQQQKQKLTNQQKQKKPRKLQKQLSLRLIPQFSFLFSIFNFLVQNIYLAFDLFPLEKKDKSPKRFIMWCTSKTFTTVKLVLDWRWKKGRIIHSCILKFQQTM